METLQRRVPKTELARNTRQVINAVIRGEATLIESHGQPEAAIVDIVDYRIMRAVLRYHARQPAIDKEAGLPDELAHSLQNDQDRFDTVLAHYLASAINLGRAAELLDLPWLDLRTRFLRLDVPLSTTPSDLSEAKVDIKTAENWSAS